jgi:hypothetical protein
MVNGRVHAFNAGDLRQVADLGHGTCGQVLKMQHIDTGFMLAVKVCAVPLHARTHTRVCSKCDAVVTAKRCDE